MSYQRYYRMGRHSGRRTVISKVKFEGARRYRYYYHGKEEYFYSDCEPDKIFDKKSLWLLLLYIPIMGAILFPMYKEIKENTKPYDTSIVIKDEVNVLEQTESLNDALNGFCKKTKITPAVISVTVEDWMDYETLEDYAYDRYLSEFADGNHWLIIYSQFGEYGDSDYIWLFEEIQGNDTGKILTEAVTQDFETGLYDKLEALQRPEQAIAEEFTEITEKIQTPSFLQKWIGMILGIPMMIFLIVSAYFSLELYNWKYRNGKPAPEEEFDLEENKKD